MVDLRRRLIGSSAGSVIVIGLGRFGQSLARTLESLGSEVLGVDSRSGRVADMRDQLTHVDEADTTDVRALDQLGAAEFDHAVVAIGSDMVMRRRFGADAVEAGHETAPSVERSAR